MIYPDLTSYRHFLQRPLSSVSNVGWLSAECDFSQGEVSPFFLKKLREAIIGNEHFQCSSKPGALYIALSALRL